MKNIELRWALRTRKVMQPLYPDHIGSPFRMGEERYRVLQYRERVLNKETTTTGTWQWSEWEDVPEVPDE